MALQAKSSDQNRALQAKAQENAKNVQLQREQAAQKQKQDESQSQQQLMAPMMEAIKQNSQAQSEFRDELKKLNQLRRKRKGKAKLPSGAEMVFEMEDS